LRIFLQRDAEFPEGMGNKLLLANPRAQQQPTENQNQPMKTISILAAMFLSAALSASAQTQEKANGRIPFNGTMQASESYLDFGDPPSLFFVNAGGVATITNLGQLTMVYTFIVDYATGDGIGRARFIAANGDTIFTSSTGISGPSGDEFVVVERHTITGGTGRYAAAKGSFTVNRLIDVTTGTTSGSIHGSIIVRGNPH
jgi:hypothetical protein